MHVDKPEFKLINMCGRPVLIRAVHFSWEKKEVCPDCGDAALYKVFEINPSPPQPAHWFYCGECCIGP